MQTDPARLWFLVPLCFGLLAAALRTTYLGRASRSWVTTQGVVFYVKETHDGDDAKYRHAVNGFTYTSAKWMIGDWSFYSFKPSPMYPKAYLNQTLEVRYDPKHPGRSTVLVGAEPMIFVFACLGLGLTLLSLVLALGWET